MQAAELLSFIKNPGLLNQEDVKRLEELTADFPYFQPAQLLLCIAARKWDAGVYQHQLKRSAIAAASRSRLYDLIKQVEKEMAQAPAVGSEQEPVTTPPKIKDPSTEEELRIVNAGMPEHSPGQDPVKKKLPFEPHQKLPEDFLEQEIRKQTTVAIVDKEIISSEPDPKPEIAAASPASPKEAGSFSEWLDLLKQPSQLPPPGLNKKREKATEPESAPTASTPAKEPSSTENQSDELQKAKRIKQKALIDKIIESSPGVIRPKEDQKFFTPERKAKESLLENEHLVTETLAKIYAMQGNTAKAIRSYEILSLKYPQKSAYFASLIQKLKQNQ